MDKDSREHLFLDIRNIAVSVAGVFFILSMIIHNMAALLKGIAYCFGAGAYVFELLYLTDCFKKPANHKELYMVYWFGILYIILGITYFIEHRLGYV